MQLFQNLPNLHDFLSSVEYKRRYIGKVLPLGYVKTINFWMLFHVEFYRHVALNLEMYSLVLAILTLLSTTETCHPLLQDWMLWILSKLNQNTFL